MIGGWTQVDGEILTAMARRIVNATVAAQTIPARETDPQSRTGLGPHWPDRAYQPSRTWAANLNL